MAARAVEVKEVTGGQEWCGRCGRYQPFVWIVQRARSGGIIGRAAHCVVCNLRLGTEDVVNGRFVKRRG